MTRYLDYKPFLDTIKDSAMKTILKYENPNFVDIQNQYKNMLNVSFTNSGKKDFENLI